MILLVLTGALTAEVNPAGAAPATATVRAGGPDALAWIHTEPSPDILQTGLQSRSALVRAHATWVTADRAAVEGRIEASRRARRRVGWVEHAWWAPAKPGDATRAALRAVPAGAWRPLSANAIDGRLRPASAANLREVGAAWLAVTLRADRAERVELWLGTSGRATLLLPGAPPEQLPEHPKAGLDQHGFELRVPPGRHLVALHLWDEDRAGEAVLRLTRDGERPSERVFTSDATADGGYEGGASQLSAPDDGPGPPVSARPLAHPASSPIGPLDAAERLRRAKLVEALGLGDRRDRPQRPVRDLRGALALAPEWPAAWAELGRLLAEREPDRARAAFERALELKSDLAAAWLGLGELARRADRPLHAARAYDRALTSDPSLAAAWVRRSELGFDALGETALAVRRLETSPAVDDPEACAQIARVRQAMGDASGAEEWAQRGLRADGTSGLLRSMAFDAAVRRLDLDEAVRLAEVGRELEPDRPRWYLELARLLAVRAPTASTASIDAARRRFPSQPEVHVAAAELAQLAGRTDAALEHLESALRASPRDRDLEAWVAELRGQPPAHQTASAAALLRIAGQPESSAEQEHGAAVLLETRDIRLEDDGSWGREVHRYVRVLDPDRHPELATAQVDFAPSRETVKVSTARRVTARGEIVPAEDTLETLASPRVDGMYVDQSTRLIDFGALRPGDVIELKYRVESIGPNPFGSFFGSIELTQRELPVKELVVRASSPKSQPLYATSWGVPPPFERQTAAGRALEWKLRDLEAMSLEPLGPAYTEVAGFISVSSYDDWRQLAAWYADLYAEQLTLDPRSRNAARAVIGDLREPAAVVDALFDHVVATTRYVGIELGIHGWKPYAAHEVARRGYGDCKDMSSLLIALLAEVGIDASLVLVRTVDRGPFPEDAVNLWAFNHAVVWVPELDRYLDPTFPRGGGRLPPEVEGALGLVVAPSGAHRLVALPEAGPEAHANEARYEARISEDGELHLRGTERYVGAPAAQIRQQFEAPDARARELELRMGRHFPGFTVEALSFTGLDAHSEEVEYAYEARVGRYGQQEQDRLVLAVSLFQPELAAAYAATAGRRSPVRLMHPWRAHNVVRYRVPERARIAQLPESRRVTTPWVALEQKLERTPDGFVVEDTVTFRARRIEVDDYTAFRDACRAIDRAMSRSVVIEWE